MTLPQDIDALKELLGKVTPGPWGLIGIPYYEYWIVEAHEVDNGKAQKHPISKVCHTPGKGDGGFYVNTQREYNAQFIVAARNALPAILERMRLLESVAEAAQINPYKSNLLTDMLSALTPPPSSTGRE